MKRRNAAASHVSRSRRASACVLKARKLRLTRRQIYSHALLAVLHKLHICRGIGETKSSTRAELNFKRARTSESASASPRAEDRFSRADETKTKRKKGKEQKKEETAISTEAHSREADSSRPRAMTPPAEFPRGEMLARDKHPPDVGFPGAFPHAHYTRVGEKSARPLRASYRRQNCLPDYAERAPRLPPISFFLFLGTVLARVAQRSVRAHPVFSLFPFFLLPR